MKTTHRFISHGGFVLLEVVLALALFALVAVSMTAAINQMSLASRSSRQEGMVLRALESIVAEVSHQSGLVPQTMSYPANDAGVAAEAVVTKAALETAQKTRLDHFFLITVDAWIEHGGARLMKRHLETYAYSPDSPAS